MMLRTIKGSKNVFFYVLKLFWHFTIESNLISLIRSKFVLTRKNKPFILFSVNLVTLLRWVQRNNIWPLDLCPNKWQANNWLSTLLCQCRDANSSCELFLDKKKKPTHLEHRIMRQLNSWNFFERKKCQDYKNNRIQEIYSAVQWRSIKE